VFYVAIRSLVLRFRPREPAPDRRRDGAPDLPQKA
jgi:hypothetical protein